MSNIPCIYCNHKDDAEENGCNIYYHKFKCEKYSAYLDGREDAIDEIVEKCKTKRYKTSKYTSINVVDYADIFQIAEQIKEYKNE